MTLKNDIAIENIRNIRHQISAECGHDPKKIVDRYAELQKKYEKALQQFTQDEEKREELVNNN